MATPEEQNRIEELKRALYSRQGGPKLKSRPVLRPKEYGVEKDFQPIQDEEDTSPSTNIFKNVFIFSLFFFVVALMVAGYFYLNGGNVVSAKNVDIAVLGPTSIGAGESLSIDIDVTNKNTVDLQLVDLVVTYPAGTKDASSTMTDLPEQRVSLGTIKPGETVQKTVEATLFGEQGDTEQIGISAEYRLTGSNAVFHADKTYELTIGSSPISLKIDSLKEINSGQELVVDTHITSNSVNIIKNLLMKVDFPFGFQYESATPTPIATQNTWSIGDLEPGGTREILFKGIVVGQDNDSRIFHFYTGSASDQDQNSIGKIFVSTTQDVQVQKPFLGVNLAIDGSSDDPHVSPNGQNMRGELTWTNNLDVPVNNTVIDLKLSGAVLNKASVTASGGFYSSSNNTIEWSSETDPDLGELKPGESGKVVFELSSVDLSTLNAATLKNPGISLQVAVHGKRFSESNVPQDIVSTLTRNVKIGANLGINVTVLHAAQDTGPIPPKVDVPTTYTITLQSKNALNDVKNAYLLGQLPQYVTWLNSVTGTGVSYNPVTRQVRWDIGSINAGTGYDGSAPRTMSFQVSLLPSISQLGTAPALFTGITLTGGDTFTGQQVTTPPIKADTKLTGQSGAAFDSDKVVE